MNSAAQGVLYSIALWAAFVAARTLDARLRPYARRVPFATIAALIAVGVSSLLQLTVAPGLLPALSRTPTELVDGELWRLVTSLVVQDGGVWGTAFNLIALAFIGLVAEQVWGWRRWLAIWLVAGIGSQFWGLVVQPTGAGNSVATFGLAATVSVVAVMSGKAISRIAGGLSLAVGPILLVLADIHGGAVVLGAATAIILRWRLLVRRSGTRSPSGLCP